MLNYLFLKKSTCMKKMSTIRLGVLSVILAAAFAFKGDNDVLHKRDFTVQITEGIKPKTIADEISFKDGKVWCGETIFDKTGLKWIRYELKKDSTYKEDDMDIEYIEVLATTEMERGELFEMKCIVENYQIEGTMRVHKAGKDKKSWSFTGSEKPKKKK